MSPQSECGGGAVVGSSDLVKRLVTGLLVVSKYRGVGKRLTADITEHAASGSSKTEKRTRINDLFAAIRWTTRRP